MSLFFSALKQAFLKFFANKQNDEKKIWVNKFFLLRVITKKMKKLNKTKNIICPLRRHLLKTGHHPFFLILRAKLFFGLISNMVLLIITCFLIFCIFRFIKSCFGGTKRDFHFLEISCFCSVFHLLPLYKPGLKGLRKLFCHNKEIQQENL